MNILPPSKANTRKLLSGTPSVSSNKEILTEPKNNLLGIKKQVDEIKNLVTNLTTLKKKSLKLKRKEDYQNRFAEKEKKLEEKKKPEDNNKIKMPNIPKLGFLDVIKRFIVNTLFGYIAVRLIDHLPKLIEVAGLLGNALDFITDFGGTILNGLATFIQKAYVAYDFTRNTLKSFGGDNALKLFDGFNKALDGVILAALAASFALADMAGGDSGGRGFDSKGRGVGKETQRRFAEKYGRDEFIKRFGKENLKNIPKSMQRGALTKLGRNVLVGTLGKGGVKTAIKILKPLSKGIPVIGGLVEFGLSLLDGDSVGKAAFKATGATLFGAIGAALGGPFALFTGIGGSVLGSFAAEKLYDFIFKGKSTSSSVAKAVGGGQPVTRGGKLVGGVPKRKIKKSKKRTINVQPTPIKPGSSVGGEKKIETVFPQTTDKNVVNPLGYIKSSYSKISEEPFFGSLMGISMKSLVGQKPSKVDYRNAAQGLNNWMNVTFSDEILRTGSLYAAGGGEVNAEMLSRMGGDMTDVIAKSLEESISKKVDDAINDLMKQMMLKPNIIEKEKPPGQEPGVDMGGGGSATDAIGGARLFMAEGFPMLAAAILAGNVQAESAWKGQRTPWVLNDGAGTNKGLISWNRSRIVNAEKFLGKPLETASNAEQVRWIKEELKQYGLLDEFMDPNRTESQLKSDSYKYIGWGIEGDRWTQSARIFAALQKGEQGTFIPGNVGGGALGTGYGSGGSKIAGELGDYMKQVKIPTGSIHQHPRHLPMKRRGYKSYHNEGRAIDLGGYGPAHPSSGGRDEQAPILRSLIEWNKKRGVTPVEVIHGSPAFGGFGKYESSPNALHSHHVHVAYFHGGVAKKTGLHMLHKGEFVVDKDSVDLVGKDFIASINAIENKTQLNQRVGSLIEHLKYITGYEPGGEQEVILPLPEPAGVVPVMMPFPVATGGGFISNNDSYNPIDDLYTQA